MAQVLNPHSSAQDIKRHTETPLSIVFILVAAASVIFFTYAILLSLTAPGALPFLFGLLLAPLVLHPRMRLVTVANLIILQSLIISITASLTDATSSFSLLQGTSYLVSVAAGALGLIELNRDKEWKSIVPLRLMGLWVCLVIAYAFLGKLQGAEWSAILGNFRNFTIGPILFIVGLAASRSLPLSEASNIFKAGLLLLLAFGAIEAIDPDGWYSTIDYARYLQLKNPQAPFASLLDVKDEYTRSLFNLSFLADLHLQTLRLSGPLLHPISFAYAITNCALIGLVFNSTLLLLPAFVILVMIGAKGPLILFLLMVAAWIAQRQLVPIRWVAASLASILAGYAFIAVAIGIRNADYHVIGFLGGIKGFLGNPIGHGLGVGGNFSNPLVTVNWSDFQKYGADYGLESAIGVALYQMGIAAMGLPMLMAGLITKNLPNMQPPSSRLIAVGAIAIIFVNAIFQEEAFAPAALGLASLSLGLFIKPQPNEMQNIDE